MDYIILALCLICIVFLCLKGIHLNININFNYPEVPTEPVKIDDEDEELEAVGEVLQTIRDFMLDEESEDLNG